MTDSSSIGKGWLQPLAAISARRAPRTADTGLKLQQPAISAPPSRSPEGSPAISSRRVASSPACIAASSRGTICAVRGVEQARGPVAGRCTAPAKATRVHARHPAADRAGMAPGVPPAGASIGRASRLRAESRCSSGAATIARRPQAAPRPAGRAIGPRPPITGVRPAHCGRQELTGPLPAIEETAPSRARNRCRWSRPAYGGHARLKRPLALRPASA
jgi:hypothetical protein